MCTSVWCTSREVPFRGHLISSQVVRNESFSKATYAILGPLDWKLPKFLEPSRMESCCPWTHHGDKDELTICLCVCCFVCSFTKTAASIPRPILFKWIKFYSFLSNFSKISKKPKSLKILDLMSFTVFSQSFLLALKQNKNCNSKKMFQWTLKQQGS